MVVESSHPLHFVLAFAVQVLVSVSLGLACANLLLYVRRCRQGSSNISLQQRVNLGIIFLGGRTKYT